MQPQPIQIEATQEMTITLQAQEWQIVMEALAERPFKIAAPLIQKFNQQFEAVTQPAAPKTNGAQDPAAPPH
jgi:hypothetical protein